jgi:hypothetical protein
VVHANDGPVGVTDAAAGGVEINLARAELPWFMIERFHIALGRLGSVGLYFHVGVLGIRQGPVKASAWTGPR